LETTETSDEPKVSINDEETKSTEADKGSQESASLAEGEEYEEIEIEVEEDESGSQAGSETTNGEKKPKKKKKILKTIKKAPGKMAYGRILSRI